MTWMTSVAGATDSVVWSATAAASPMLRAMLRVKMRLLLERRRRTVTERNVTERSRRER